MLTAGNKALLMIGMTAVGVLALSAPATASTFRGTVVHKNSRAHSFAVAMRSGKLRAVHAKHAPRVGRVVRVRARKLTNGTYAARRTRVLGSRRHADIRGTVSYVSRSARTYTVSARGVSLLINAQRATTRSAGADSLPAVGKKVKVEVDLSGDDLEEQDVKETGDATNFDLEGRILAIDETARTLSVSADDEDQLGVALTVNVPAEFDMSLFEVGQEVELTVTLNDDGTYTLKRLSSDDNEQEADDPAEDQGDDDGGDDGHQGSDDDGHHGGGDDD